ncbi:28S ribosomal protein L42, mitochondrial-like [Mercenaria mercenaria]|uniref:28S ribosomal protein L42, mitochondrial-like n=1 Tax=Mercenaria mercenaria TaxID=6596 RepID=UPI001E1D5F30|nr:28S ribosomal protein L42, mitochondrial-like [Mercenaria mercenaria]
MAASMKIVLRTAQSYSRASVAHRCAVINRSCHSKSSSDDSEQSARLPRVGMSADGSTLIGWHPEPEHPYEHTKPIEYDMKKAGEGTVLKDELVRDYVTRYRPSGPTTPELSAITFTTKHQWLPKSGKKYQKRNPPKDRDAI